MVNMKGMCCTCLQCTFLRYRKLRSYKVYKSAPAKPLSYVRIPLDYPLVIRPSADSKNQVVTLVSFAYESLLSFIPQSTVDVAPSRSLNYWSNQNPLTL